MISTLFNQLPYKSRNESIFQTNKLLEVYPTLSASIVSFVHNDGQTEKLISLKGTIPINYKGVIYNIPVEIILTKEFPSHPPKFYVRPVESMIVKPNHRHVDMQGLIYLPYLSEWNFNSNLLMLVETASSVFSIDPPLYSRPSTISPSNTTSTTSVSNTNPNSHKPILPTSSTTQASLPQVSQSTTSATNYNRQILINNVNNKLKLKASQICQVISKEISEEMSIQADLNSTQVELDKLKLDLKKKMNSLNKAEDEINEKQEKLTELKGKASEKESEKNENIIDENIIEYYDDLSSQILQLSSEVSSIDDLLYVLEKALIQGSIDLNTFLRETRSLANKQFTSKFHLKKIQAQCLQAQANPSYTIFS